ncbi:MAG: hypothetical protein A2Y48_01380 [Nitrospirae bacterium RIFCSPLOW2_12_42_9]|nr:MAG: hypothetical protein A2035_01855 [Nitrospirae bacterium GWA2_42_11]OGW57227.1 MAG: hypothetical protein A3D21_04665 [Nitrospirae bacterium RIFCSPHIGHO2_02_FULL_42_12]OGW59642.1 MAG: hypothetical protein A2Y48_01380 [Nitrospirae bacterium RIFCSPLOW2_12_42_9]HAS16377.1 DUF4416 domain-containing protein [Nitrospiraceae bacterium]HBI23157.1 DUF4416 domain-containing protein [Nitrospiraceae bacterium]
MIVIRPVEQAKLFTALLSREEKIFDVVKENLCGSFGPVDYISPVLPWTHSRYYEKEMGSDLKRAFFFFKDHVQPELLADIKNTTNKIEVYFKNETNLNMPVRPVNIDPGYMTLSKVVLASTKDYSHRVYLGKGIYAEVTLYYMDKSYKPFPYTYPDYRSKEYILMFNSIREKLLCRY